MYFLMRELFLSSRREGSSEEGKLEENESSVKEYKAFPDTHDGYRVIRVKGEGEGI
jgi:hypothetical protein